MRPGLGISTRPDIPSYLAPLPPEFEQSSSEARMFFVLPTTRVLDLRLSLTLVARVPHCGDCRFFCWEYHLEPTGDLDTMVEGWGGSEAGLNGFLENLRVTSILRYGHGF